MTNKTDQFGLNRRTFLNSCVGSLGPLALAHLLGTEQARADNSPAFDHPLATRPGGKPARAKAVICLFQNGGPSQMDLFDPKPLLGRYHGQPYPGDLETHFHKQVGNVLASPFQFHKHGDSGMELSELIPHTARLADRMTLIRSMQTLSVDHEQALHAIHTGRILAGHPVWGSWVVYGLGTERLDLPAHVVLTDSSGLPIDGIRNWSSGYLPAICQGTAFRSGNSPVLNLTRPDDISVSAQRNQLDLLRGFNAAHQRLHPDRSDLAAQIANYELAARMQTSVPAVLDIERETEQTRRLYGLDNPVTEDYGKRCLLARRLVEQGVRFVQVYMNSQPWDTHSNNAANLRNLTARTDQPAAALVADLEQRGLLDSTIVMFTGEFGRLPVSQGADGRDHNRRAFSLWLAGGGFRGGYTHGSTDEFGYEAAEDVVTVHDLHATLMHTLGLDHRRLDFPHAGRRERLTDPDVTGARVVNELLV